MRRWGMNTSRRHLQSAGRRLLNVPHQRWSTFAGRALSAAGPLVWNSLPDYLRDPAVSRGTFCKHLKTFLFAVYWYTFSALEVLRSCAIYIYVLLTYLTVINYASICNPTSFSILIFAYFYCATLCLRGLGSRNSVCPSVCHMSLCH